MDVSDFLETAIRRGWTIEENETNRVIVSKRKAKAVAFIKSETVVSGSLYDRNGFVVASVSERIAHPLAVGAIVEAFTLYS